MASSPARPIPETEALLDIAALEVRFPGHTAVRQLDLQVFAGQTVALVGESGCGKSTTALAAMRLLPAQARLGGRLSFAGEDMLALSERAMADLRGREISMIFQEPMTSLNPVHSIGRQVMESLSLHQRLPREQLRAQALALLDMVKLPQAARRFDDYPHHLSGGQRQRVMIAMAVACKPRLLIADEPTTALDVTIQSQILALIDELRRELGMAVLLITHDLGVVEQWAERVAVMHGGRKLEEGPTRRVFAAPHLYAGPARCFAAPAARAALPPRPAGRDQPVGGRRVHLVARRHARTAGRDHRRRRAAAART